MTATKVSPESRPAHIATLIESVDRYNPSNCHLLEDYLQEQLAKGTYDLLSNLALLKLYQFNPTLISPNAALSILFLTLSHAPFSPDFNLAWSLLSDSFVVGASLPPPPPTSDDDNSDDESTPAPKAPSAPHGERETAETLKAFSTLLSARKFKAFWSKLRGGQENKEVEETIKELLKSAVGFEANLRDVIANEVEASFKGVSRKTLASFLGLEPSSPELSTLIEAQKWTVDGDVVSIPANDSNSPTSTLQRERIEIEQLARVLERSQA